MSTSKQATPGRVLSLAARFATKVGSLGVSDERVRQAIDDGKDPLWVAVTDAFCPKPDALSQQVAKEEQRAASRSIQILSERPKPCAQRSLSDQVDGLQRMYTKHRWTWTWPGLVIPPRQRGFDRLLVFAYLQDPMLSNNLVFDVCQALFPSWRYTDNLDSAIPAEDDQRHPSRKPYAIWVRDEVGPDRDLMGLSESVIADRGLKTLTVLERMFLELVYYGETRDHLDLSTLTLCAGSRCTDGTAPYVDYTVRRFKIRWYNSSDGDPDVGARQAVTL